MRSHDGYVCLLADCRARYCGDNCTGAFPGPVVHAVKDEVVNHPAHYTFGTIEVIDALEDWQLGFHAGNAVKYIARAKHKGNELEDLRKARWYLDRLIGQLEK